MLRVQINFHWTVFNNGLVRSLINKLLVYRSDIASVCMENWPLGKCETQVKGLRVSNMKTFSKTSQEQLAKKLIGHDYNLKSNNNIFIYYAKI